MPNGSKRVLLTGGAGFAGLHIAEHILHNTDWDVVVLDRLSYAGSLERLRGTIRDFPGRLQFVYHDFRSAFPSSVLHMLEAIEYVIHNGGETHVQNSLIDPLPFVESNVKGTMNMLEASRQLGVKHFIYVSTDEVHGPAPDSVSFKEDATIRPSNPYAASKAGGEALAYAWYRSFSVPVTITRTMNLFGEMQHPEKFIPMTIRKIMNDEKVIVHGTADGRVGSRKWIHARNQADALLFLLKAEADTVGRNFGSGVYGKPIVIGETFHIAGEEHTNLEMAQFIAEALKRDWSHEIVDYHSSRPGHDLRYSLDDSKLRNLGWKPPVEFRESLERMVQWTADHPQWLAGELAQEAAAR
jgi:dTDP-glucose 4,6-dehydratase